MGPVDNLSWTIVYFGASPKILYDIIQLNGVTASIIVVHIQTFLSKCFIEALNKTVLSRFLKIMFYPGSLIG